MIFDVKRHLNKDYLHHAYLLEGNKESLTIEILDFLKMLGVETMANPDFYHMEVDVFKTKDAHDLRSFNSSKSFSENTKKIFLVSANNFLLEAQNILLKMFEEPLENTHFFVITPNTGNLLKTLVSRFYFIKDKTNFSKEIKNAEKFIKKTKKERINFLKDYLADDENEKSKQSRTLEFLNMLEFTLHEKIFSKQISESGNNEFFLQMFKARKFIQQPGSSVKNIMESLALNIPNF